MSVPKNGMIATAPVKMPKASQYGHVEQVEPGRREYGEHGHGQQLADGPRAQRLGDIAQR